MESGPNRHNMTKVEVGEEAREAVDWLGDVKERIKENPGGITIEGIPLEVVNEDEIEALHTFIRAKNPKISDEGLNNIKLHKINVGGREMFMRVIDDASPAAWTFFYERDNDGPFQKVFFGGYHGVSFNEDNTINLGTPYFAQSEIITNMATLAQEDGLTVRIDERAEDELA